MSDFKEEQVCTKLILTIEVLNLLFFGLSDSFTCTLSFNLFFLSSALDELGFRPVLFLVQQI